MTKVSIGYIASGMDKKPLPTMTPDELRAVRNELGGTQTEAAARYGVAPLTYKRWELGTREIPGTAVMHSRVLLQMKRRNIAVDLDYNINQ